LSNSFIGGTPAINYSAGGVVTGDKLLALSFLPAIN
jgi:hypothetical protein